MCFWYIVLVFAICGLVKAVLVMRGRSLEKLQGLSGTLTIQNELWKAMREMVSPNPWNPSKALENSSILNFKDAWKALGKKNLCRTCLEIMKTPWNFAGKGNNVSRFFEPPGNLFKKSNSSRDRGENYSVRLRRGRLSRGSKNEGSRSRNSTVIQDWAQISKSWTDFCDFKCECQPTQDSKK